MSSPLAIAAVTAVLRELLHDALVDHAVSSIVPSAQVTALAPDRIALGDTGTPGLNVYLYATTPNAGWRNAGLPSRGGDGQRLTNPPLALDLSYLVTAYGTDELQAEVLLGVAMQRLHEVPVLERDTIRSVVQNASTLSGQLAASGLEDQVEQIKVAPAALGAEQISKLWAAFQASYRPTAAYLASVVLVEVEAPVRTALPVLTRGPVDVGTQEERGVLVVPSPVPPFPTLTAVEAPDGQPAAQLGDPLVLRGHHLGGTNHAVVFSHTRFDIEHAVAPATVAADRITVAIPDAPADWPAGLYAVRVAVTQDGDLTTNRLGLALAPTMDPLGVAVVLTSGTATITVPVEPHVRAEQAASLVVGEREVHADPVVGTASALTFVLEDAVAGTYLFRLRIDGVESVYIDRTPPSPSFDGSQQIAIPTP